MNRSLWAGTLAGLLIGLGSAQPGLAQQEQIPDAPRPSVSLPVIPAAPGVSPKTETGPAQQAPAASAMPAAPTPSSTAPKATGASAIGTAQADQEAPPEEGLASFTLPSVNVNYVIVPFTVKDSKNHLVPGIKSYNVVLLENNVPMHITQFSDDAAPLSTAVVVDQSLTHDQMDKVNAGLKALPGAFAASDEVALLTYNNSPILRTTFTGSQSERLYWAVETAKSAGRDAQMTFTGPLTQNLNINNGAMEHTDPNTNSTMGRSLGNVQNIPIERHTLTDAIYAAAKELTAHTDYHRRRVIFVISDGKDYGNTAKPSEVVRFLQQNNISVYGTLVHAYPNLHIPFSGFVDRLHLPLTMRDDILPMYANVTGGQIDPEFSVNGIETSLQKIAETARTQYTVGYYTHEPVIDGKFRNITVIVRGFGNSLNIIAEKGYYPRAQRNAPGVQPVTQPSATGAPGAKPATPPATKPAR